MTIDERLDKLAERHEALTQTVELMVMENRERDAKWDKRFDQLTTRTESLTSTVEAIAALTQTLAIVAESHERRITHFEGGPTA